MNLLETIIEASIKVNTTPLIHRSISYHLKQLHRKIFKTLSCCNSGDENGAYNSEGQKGFLRILWENGWIEMLGRNIAFGVRKKGNSMAAFLLN